MLYSDLSVLYICDLIDVKSMTIASVNFSKTIN
jgi:hypothetical protein